MLYGSEFIRFQKLHAEPLQRVVNIAAMWIVALARSNTSTNAFSLCYELGLPPIFLEMSAVRAQLGIKLDAQPKMKTWIQNLWDSPATFKSRHMTWVAQTKKWLEMVEKEKHKYSQTIIPLPGMYHLEELRVRANQYRSDFIESIRAEFIGEFANGAPVETPRHNETSGELASFWHPNTEFLHMEENGVMVPKGRTCDEVAKLLLVQHVILECLMATQKTASWGKYDIYHFGMSRGYLREAVNRTDLSEGVHWLVLARTRAFPQVEWAWQQIANYWESAPNTLLNDWGTTDQNRIRARVITVYLLGGIIRLQLDTQDQLGWFDIYQLGFGHFRLVTPGFTAHHYVDLAQFLQLGAPLYVNALRQELYDGRSVTDSLSEGSLDDGDVNQEMVWRDGNETCQWELTNCEVWQETLGMDANPPAPSQ
ncbi:hypothetical protein H4582DRAFT_2060848 [Lactarius indigo]|nr:hypothetical protein H4582DRAFT_2065102 [Lactarius indigo]KAI9433655.1 hypothetical protein H4582DRAFT_2060848 [Lactarius indigo]